LLKLTAMYSVALVQGYAVRPDGDRRADQPSVSAFAVLRDRGVHPCPATRLRDEYILFPCSPSRSVRARWATPAALDLVSLTAGFSLQLVEAAACPAHTGRRWRFDDGRQLGNRYGRGHALLPRPVGGSAALLGLELGDWPWRPKARQANPDAALRTEMPILCMTGLPLDSLFGWRHSPRRVSELHGPACGLGQGQANARP